MGVRAIIIGRDLISVGPWKHVEIRDNLGDWAREAKEREVLIRGPDIKSGIPQKSTLYQSNGPWQGGKISP